MSASKARRLASRSGRDRARIPNVEIEAIVRAHRFGVQFDKLHWDQKRRVLRWLLDRCGKSQDEPKF